MPEVTHITFDGPATAAMTVALAHGAGAPMDSPFMNAVAAGLADNGLRVARFEFPYMARRRSDGTKKPPDRAPVLLQTWREVIDRLGRDRLIVGGKSMGGRIASMIAATLEQEGTPASGVACLGYPFHPPGKPERLRTEHLETIKTPTLILQGERDPFGKRDEVEAYSLSDAVQLHWLADGDHGFKPRKASGRTEADSIEEAVAVLAEFAGAR
ncbi:MAG: dienelactone hydrolase family protein [Alphaproteobacteria bacterium]